MSANWTGAPRSNEPLEVSLTLALSKANVRGYSGVGLIATSDVAYRHLPFGGGGKIWSPGEHWRRMPQPEPQEMRETINAMFRRHEQRPVPLAPQYR